MKDLPSPLILMTTQKNLDRPSRSVLMTMVTKTNKEGESPQQGHRQSLKSERGSKSSLLYPKAQKEKNVAIHTCISQT